MIQIVIKALVVAATIMINVRLGSSVSLSPLDSAVGDSVVPGVVDEEWVLIDLKAVIDGIIIGVDVAAEEDTRTVLLVETVLEVE